MKKTYVFIMFIIIALAGWADNFKSIEKDNVFIAWEIEGDTIHIKMTAYTEGWIAIGIGAEMKMKGADIIIGYVKDGEVFIRDDYGNSPISHRADTSGGGEDNILSASGVESRGVTTIEFTIPLDSGDDRDNRIIPGKTYRVIYACGRKDNFTSIHSKRGSLEITF